MTKIVAVFGATGQQGGSVLRSLSKTGNYQLRAITRNKNSDKAKELAKLKNVTVEEADLDDSKSVDHALKGCYGAFLVTDFSAHLEHKEVKQGTTFIDSAIKNKLSHIVFSGLENVQSQVNKPCLHFDYKEEVEKYGLKHSDKINFTSIRMPMFYQELYGIILYKISDKQFSLNVPMEGELPLYIMNVDDIGDCVTTLFNDPNKYKSKIIPVAGEHLPVNEIVSIMNKHLAPNKIFFQGGAATKTVFKSFQFPGVEDVIVMFEYYETGKMRRDLKLTKEINPKVLGLEEWLAKNKQSILQSLEKK